jgi:hypothetical protein
MRRDAENKSQLDVREVTIPSGRVQFKEELILPTGELGPVIFAHGIGHHSRCNQSVARTLQNDGLGAPPDNRWITYGTPQR